jgi:hypothetical protein
MNKQINELKIEDTQDVVGGLTTVGQSERLPAGHDRLAARLQAADLESGPAPGPDVGHALTDPAAQAFNASPPTSQVGGLCFCGQALSTSPSASTQPLRPPRLRTLS